MGYNLNEVMELVEWAEENNLNGIIFHPLFHNFGSAYRHGWWKESILWPQDMEKLDRIMDKLVEMSETFHQPMADGIIQQFFRFRKVSEHAEKFTL